MQYTTPAISEVDRESDIIPAFGLMQMNDSDVIPAFGLIQMKDSDQWVKFYRAQWHREMKTVMFCIVPDSHIDTWVPDTNIQSKVWYN